MQLREEFLEKILYDIPAIISVYREKPIFANKYFEKLTGYKIEEVKDKYIWDFCPEYCKNKSKERVLKRIKGELLETLEETYPFKKKDGSLIYLKCISKTIEIDKQYYGLLLAVDITKQIELENKLMEQIEIVKNVNVPIFEVILNKDLKVKKFIPLNNKFFELTGYSEEENLDENFFFKNLHPEDRKNFKPELILEKNKHVWEFRFRKKDGKYIWIKEFLTVIKREDIIKLVITWLDITKEKKLENNLRKTLDELNTLIRYSPDIVVKIDKNGVIKFKSLSVEKLGYKVSEVLGKNIFDYIHPNDRRSFKSILNFAFKNKGKTYTIEYRVINAEGKYVWFEGNFVVPENQEYAYLIERDITDKKKIEIKLQKYMYYDPITNLPNKILFIENLRGILYKRKDKVFIAVFKILNLNKLFLIYGEKKVLKTIANIIRSEFPDFIVARTLTNEFLIGGSIENSLKLYSKLNVLKQNLNNLEFIIEYNIGVSITDGIPETPEDLINRAYIALYKSMKEGKNKISFYKPEVEKEVEREIRITELLPEAIRNNELIVYYQPIYKLKTKNCIGFETLLRWFSKELGYVSPSEFIPIAENIGFIVNITEFVLNSAIKDISNLDNKCFITINFSAKEFEHPQFVKNVLKTLEKYNFPYDKFVVEITERLAMKNPERTKYILALLREKGIKIAIDDFGTGYSSMKYLTEFNVDKIKIDHEFVIKITEEYKSEAVVDTIISLAHSLSATALAEGIENKKILDKLLTLNCDEGQGYYLSKPVPFEKLKELLKINEN